MRSGTEQIGAKRRMLFAGALIIGLIGMHHLIVAGCLNVSSGHGDSHVTQSHMGDTPQSHMGDTPQSVDPGHTQSAAGGTENHGAICMAILMIFSVIVPTLRAMTTRKRIMSIKTGPRGSQRTTDPPTAVILSVFRT
jgi:hypothetical protein